MKWWRNLALTLGPVVLVVVLLRGGSCRERQETKQDVEQKAAIAQSDTGKQEKVKTLRKARHATDVTLKAPDKLVYTKPEVEITVKQEREACDSALAASDQQVATRDVRIKTLEKRNGGWLFLYGEGNAYLRPEPPVSARFQAEGGLEVPLDHTTDLRAGVTTDREIKVGVHRRLRIL